MTDDTLPPAGRGNKDRRVELATRSGLCPFCPPNGGENAGRRPKHGAQKPKTRRRRV